VGEAIRAALKTIPELSGFQMGTQNILPLFSDCQPDVC